MMRGSLSEQLKDLLMSNTPPPKGPVPYSNTPPPKKPVPQAPVPPVEVE